VRCTSGGVPYAHGPTPESVGGPTLYLGGCVPSLHGCRHSPLMSHQFGTTTQRIPSQLVLIGVDYQPLPPDLLILTSKKPAPPSCGPADSMERPGPPSPPLFPCPPLSNRNHLLILNWAQSTVRPDYWLRADALPNIDGPYESHIKGCGRRAPYPQYFFRPRGHVEPAAAFPRGGIRCVVSICLSWFEIGSSFSVLQRCSL